MITTKDRINKRKYLNGYLDILKKIVSVEVDESMILSLEAMERIKDKEVREGFYETIIPFDQKEELKKIVDHLHMIQDEGILLFTDYSKYCGALQLNSLCDINWDFNFNDDPTGILVILTKDLKNKLLLDYYQNENEKWIEIEVFGRKWSLLEDVI